MRPTRPPAVPLVAPPRVSPKRAFARSTAGLPAAASARHLLPALLVGLVVAPARAEGPVFEHESEPIELILDDSIELFNASEFDTGWVPADSPLQVRFQIVSEGGASVEMEGVARLGWPEGLTLSLEPTPGTGEIIVDAALSAVSSVKFNVLDYSWDSEIDRRTLDIEGEGFFDPFLLSQQRGGPGDSGGHERVGGAQRQEGSRARAGAVVGGGRAG